jgi:hypothetical protein
MLAARMTLVKGIPRLPAGVFHNVGILLGYVTPTFVDATDFSEAIARFPSLLVYVFLYHRKEEQ